MFLDDEATSAMDAAAEARCYEALRAAVPLVVSVAHRPAVARYHTHVLERGASPEAPWEFGVLR